jgi:hypothetical protein
VILRDSDSVCSYTSSALMSTCGGSGLTSPSGMLPLSNHSRRRCVRSERNAATKTVVTCHLPDLCDNLLAKLGTADTHRGTAPLAHPRLEVQRAADAHAE